MQEKYFISVTNPILRNHSVYGQFVLPGLAYIDMIYQVFRENGYDYATLELRNVTIYNPLIVGQNDTVILSMQCIEFEDGKWKIDVEGQREHDNMVQPNKERYVSAEMHLGERVTFEERLDFNSVKRSAKSICSLEECYEHYREREVVHTGIMKAKGQVYETDVAAIIDISLGENSLSSADDFMFHPTLIDGSAIGTDACFFPLTEEKQQLFLPLFYESFCTAALLQKQCRTRIQIASVKQQKEIIHMTLEFFNEAGDKVAELKNCTSKLVRETGLIKPEGKKTVVQSDLLKSPIFKKESSDKRLLTAAEIKSFLRKLLADQMQKTEEEIDTEIGYYEMGLDSRGLLEIVKSIEAKIQTALSPTLLFEYTTIAELADYLTDNYAVQFSQKSVVPKEEEPSLSIDKTGSPISAVDSTATLQEDIAIIGIAGRYPKARNIQEFWNNLKAGKDCISEIPKSRWNWEQFEGLKSPSGKNISKWGGFIDDPDCFDPLFFRISPREAEVMDPQERLFLETCWEAIEDAGYTPKTLVSPQGWNRRRHVGVFAGVMHKDYTMIGAEILSRGQLIPLSLNCAQIANRVSYFCDFHGPSMAVDTVCSSSLTALHLAVESIKRGESEVALAGGVNLSLHSNKYLNYGMMGMHSSDAYCHTFGKGGDGYVSGEGVGVVLVKPLRRAIQDNDHIYAVIKGSVINHVGKVSGITVPSPVAQADMISACLEQSGIHPRTISYIEAHGTGTSLGDPIEIQGLVKAYLRYTQDRQFCSIGSVKSNIGHAEAAAGISGLHKIILQLYYKTLVPSLHSEEINPFIDLDQSPFYIQHKTEEWKQPTIIENGHKVCYPRRAGLSSFGATGSNAHLILEEYIPKKTQQTNSATVFAHDRPVIIPLSARNKERLQTYARNLLDFLKGRPLEQSKQSASKEDKRYQEILEDKIRSILSGIIGIKEQEIAIEEVWNEYGIEWTQIMRVREKILEDFQVNIKELNQESSISTVVEYLTKHYQETGQMHELVSEQTETAVANQTEEVIDEPYNQNIKLTDLAYTLQVGRTAMEERVAFLARDIPELIVRLEALVQGKETIDECWRGQDNHEKKNNSILSNDPDALELIHKWIANGKAAKVAEIWVEGIEIDWKLMYEKNNKPQRISLPTYPFAKERYWVPDSNKKIGNMVDKVVIHPLLHQNTSDLMEQRFSTTFTGQDFFLIDDIRNDRRILPGVACLEMARAAVEQAAGALREGKTGIRLKNVIWNQPVIVKEQPVQVHTGLFPKDNGQIHFEIYSRAETNEVLPVIHSQGDAEFCTYTEFPILDVNALQAQCGQNRISSNQCYAAFRARGIDYGSGYQGIECIYQGAGQVLAKLSLPSSVAEMQSQFTLHPSLLDSALQAAIGLKSNIENRTPLETNSVFQSFLVSSLEEIEIIGSCTVTMWASLRYSTRTSEDKIPNFDIDLYNDQGEICVRMRGVYLPVRYEKPLALSAVAESAHADLLGKVQTDLRQIVAKILKVTEKIDISLEWNAYGFDSITLTEFANFLNQSYKLSLKPTVFFEHPTLDDFSKYLFEEYQTLLSEKFQAQSEIKTVPIMEESVREVPYHMESHSRLTGGIGRFAATNTSEPIAIVGISGKFPMARDVDEFWENLESGKDCITEIPQERWDWRKYYGDPISEPKKTNIKFGGFIDGIEEFDPLFFGISPREAALMDPNQRLLMIYIWKAIEDAGYSAQSLAETKTGIFVGTAGSGYGELISRENVPLDGYSATGAVPSVGPNRMSYFLNIHGPSEPIETACSSSLVAIHRAVSAIRDGSCEMAIAGGVNTILNPELHISLSKAGMLCKDGRCKTFSDQADGYVRGEGIGMLFLKKLSKAEQAGDSIYGVILGTAENHGGRAASLTAPNPKAQAEVIKAAYTKAGIDPGTVTYIETHGTGTKLGDPIEINGLKAAFNDLYMVAENSKVSEARCGLGAVKSNIGHLELAAGIAGVIKVLLQFKHKMLVKNLHCDSINPYIQLENSPFYILQEAKEWKALKDGHGKDIPRRAGVSSFGFGGVNAHVVLEEYIPKQAKPFTSKNDSQNPVIIILSAKDKERLKEYVHQLLQAVEKQTFSDNELFDLAYTLQVGRDAMEYRVAMIVHNRNELIQTLKEYLNSNKLDKKMGDTLSIFTGNVGEDQAANEKLEDGVLPSPVEENNPEKIAIYWTHGGKVPWELFYKDKNVKRISLPTYPFAKRRCWIDFQSDSGDEEFHTQEKRNISLNEPVSNHLDHHVIDIIAGLLGITIAELNITKPLDQYGFDSILLLSLFQQLQTQVDPLITLESLRESRTTQDVINILQPQDKERTRTSKCMNTKQKMKEINFDDLSGFPEIVHFNQSFKDRPVFWFHGGLGGVEAYIGISQKVQRPFYGIKAPEIRTGPDQLCGIQKLAAYYVNIITTLQPKGPYDLGGYSLGGVIAYEVTRQLQEMGHAVDTIVMLDSFDSNALKKIKNDEKSLILQTVNMALLTIPKTEKDARILIHRDEVNLNSEKDVFCKEIIKLAKKRGLSKTDSMLYAMIQRSIETQNFYEINQFSVLPLPDCQAVTCYYFRNKSGLLFGEMEPYCSASAATNVDNTKYWEEWEKQLPNFHMMDVESSNHIRLLSEPKAFETIFAFCENLYSKKGMSAKFFQSFIKKHKTANKIFQEKSFQTSASQKKDRS